MIHSLCFYRIVMRADNHCRAACNTPRSIVRQCFKKSFEKLGFLPEAIHIGTGYVDLLINLPIQLSLSNFIEKLNLLSAEEILQTSHTELSPTDYWLPNPTITIISPGDKRELIHHINTPNQPSTTQTNTPLPLPSPSPTPQAYWHHLILVTHNSSMKLPLKHRDELHKAIHETCSKLGVSDCKCAAMRNHIHLLFTLSPDKALEPFINSLRHTLQQWMTSQNHFRQFAGWHEDSLIYAISTHTLSEENNNLKDQFLIHHPRFSPNEMSILYRRLDSNFLFQLQ